MPSDGQESDIERIRAAQSHLESYEQEGNSLQNWCKVVKARELLQEVLTDE